MNFVGRGKFSFFQCQSDVVFRLSAPFPVSVRCLIGVGWSVAL